MKLHWPIFLIGISIILVSCTESDYWAETTYQFINQSGKHVKMVSYFSHSYIEEFEINSGDTITYEVPDPWSTEKHLEPYSNESMVFPPGIIGDDSTRIIFDNMEVLTYVNHENACEENHKLYCKTAYSNQRTGDRAFIYTIIITEDDYDDAIPVKTD